MEWGDTVKFKVGAWYLIEFLDHATFGEHMIVHAAGRVIKDSGVSVHFTSWSIQHDDADIVNNNLEDFCLVKACIKKKRLIKSF